MKDRDQNVETELHTFVQGRDLDALRRALDIVENSPAASRDDQLGQWLLLLDNIDIMLDSAFNPEDVPSLGIAPPASPDVVLDSAVEPQSITDPQIRNEYEEAIRRNAEKIAVYRFQKNLRKIETRVTTGVLAHMTSAYRHTTADQAVLDALVGNSLGNRDRAARLMESWKGGR